MKRIGIIDLQGGVAEHLDHLERLGVPAARVKQPEDLEGLAGLIIPGGESSCLGRLFRLYGLDHAIRERFASGLTLWGTCAGAILMATRVDGKPAYLALMDIDIQRNAFGSQLDSFETSAEIPEMSEHPIPLVFIRAPKITRLGENVRPLLMLDGVSTGASNRAIQGARYCAAAEDERSLVTIFHPELTPDLAFHRYFCRKCGLEPEALPGTIWRRDGWTRFAAARLRT